MYFELQLVTCGASDAKFVRYLSVPHSLDSSTPVTRLSRNCGERKLTLASKMECFNKSLALGLASGSRTKHFDMRSFIFYVKN